MIVLPYENHQTLNFLHIVKRNNAARWHIYAGSWYQTGIRDMEMQFKTKEEIIMSAKNLVKFASEVRKILRAKPFKREHLELNFVENIPQFRVIMCFMHDSSHQQFFHDGLQGKFLFCPGINIHSSIVDERRRYAYLYEGEGVHVDCLLYYTPAQLEKFADDLEKEAAPYLKKPWWQFWK